jgi:paraquat-inducible protein B
MAQTESNTQSNDFPIAQISPKARFSLIWIIPITAALIGGWLIFKYYNERGTIISITFDQASGIEEKKTPIRYKDVIVGKVRKLGLTSDLKKVKVTAEVFPGMAQYLGGNTRFWVEKPRVTLKGVSGLDTLLSGVHIGIDPGTKSDPLDSYLGLSTPPFITNDKEGTRLALRTTNLGSLDIGSPIYYNKINVGQVTSYRLNSNTENIDVFIYVHEPYDNIIKSNTRFWNASGIELELTATGVSARMESLTSLLIGGIAFETPQDEIGKEIDGEIAFILYDSHKIAQDNTQMRNKLFYNMYFDDSLHGLTEDSLIEYSGVKVGKVESILLEKSDNNNRVKALVRVSLRIDKFSNKGNHKEAEETLRKLVSEGLQAQLTVDSLITGSQYISLNLPSTRLLTTEKGRNLFTLMPTSKEDVSLFPTTVAQTTLLNFDATEISAELKETLSSVRALVRSNDVKKTLSAMASTTESLSKITTQLDKEGFSGNLVKTLASAKKTTQDISSLIMETKKAVGTIAIATDKLQKDASKSMQTFNNVSNKLQKNASKTLNSIDLASSTLEKGLKSSLSEDSGLQYRLQLLINELSEASKSFSVLADTIQRKPSSVIFGK